MHEVTHLAPTVQNREKLMLVVLAEEYRTTNSTEFCKRHSMSTKTAVRLFGAKTPEDVRKRQKAEGQENSVQRKALLMAVVRETWLSERKVKSLNKEWSLTEIRNGKWTGKSFSPDSIHEYRPDPT